jgi:hypothetical protein
MQAETLAASEQTRTRAQTVAEHIVEIVSDSGEGAQTCGQINRYVFETLCLRTIHGETATTEESLHRFA